MARNVNRTISYVVESMAGQGYAGMAVIEEQKLRKGEPVGEKKLIECIPMTDVFPKRGIAQRALADAVGIIDMNLQLFDVEQ